MTTQLTTSSPRSGRAGRPQPPVRTRDLRLASFDRSRRRALRPWQVAAAFLLPATVSLVLLRLWPFGASIAESFSTSAGEFTFDHVARLLADPSFVNTLKVTLVFSLIINPVQIALALLCATVLARYVPMVGMWRTLILIPITVPQVVSAIIWSVAMRPDGPLNGLLGLAGIPPVPWFTSPDMALYSVMILCTWVGVGYWMTFLVAGIKDIPASLYEAAQIDGASTRQQFWNITLPGIRKQILFVLVADTVANFLVFAPIRIITRGGPEGSTDLIMYNVYERAFIRGDAPGAAAATVVLILIVLAIVALQFRLLPGKD